MDLEKIAVVLRPREGWEAVDLGFALVRTWWKAVLAAWVVVVLPPAILLNVLLSDYPWAALLGIWWLKPVFDRVPLAIVSRGFFGELPSPWRIVSHPRAYLGRGILGDLTFRRLLPWRSYVLPVAQLEELTGTPRRRRLAVFTEAQASLAFGFTAVAMIFEQGLFWGFYVLVLLFVPDTVESPVLFGAEAPVWAPFLLNGFYVVAMTLVEPFYVGGGFALYINRRVELEGWDIELHFRRLRARLEKLLKPGVAALLLCALLGSAAPGWAAAPADTGSIDFAGEIKEVLSAPEFQTKETAERWARRQDDEKQLDEDDGDEWDLEWLHAVGRLLSRILMWTAAVLLVLLVVYLITAWVRRRGEGEGETAAAPKRPDTLFGLDLRPESLPDDPIAAAEQAWREGNVTLAMSLLYRAALAHVVDRLHVGVPSSATEGECITIVREHLGAPVDGDFELLTRAWQLVAYAHRTPASDDFSALCNRWRPHLGARA